MAGEIDRAQIGLHKQDYNAKPIPVYVNVVVTKDKNYYHTNN